MSEMKVVRIPELPADREPSRVAPMSDAQPSESLAGQTLKGVLWTSIGSATRLGTSFLSGIVVARHLSPNDFALAGLGVTLMGVVRSVSVQGFATALVRERELDPIKCHSVFWFLTCLSIIFVTVLALISRSLARFYSQPALNGVLLVLGLVLVASLVGSVPEAIISRGMRFREQNLIVAVSGILSAILASILAVFGFGYWALVAPAAGAALATVVGAFWVSGYRPICAFSLTHLRSTAKFGTAVAGAGVLTFLSDNADYLIMSRFWPKSTFGYYYFAFERARQPFMMATTPLVGVFYPTFSRIQDDLDRIRRMYMRGTRLSALLLFPSHIILIGLADPIIPWLFGPQWLPAVPTFQVFAAFGFVRIFGIFVTPPLLALNCAQAVFYFNAFRLAVLIPALAILGLMRAQILTVSITLVAIWVIQTPFFVGFLYRKIHLGWTDFRNGFGQLLLAAGVMAAVLIMTRWVCRAQGLGDGTSSLVVVCCAVCAFVASTQNIIREMIEVVRRAFAERRIKAK